MGGEPEHISVDHFKPAQLDLDCPVVVVQRPCAALFISKEIGGMAARILNFALNIVYNETMKQLNDCNISICCNL